MKKKPPYTSHYLVLKDLIIGIDVRKYSDSLVYLCSRIENIKNDLVKEGLRFDEEAIAKSTYSYYKPYVLINDEPNMKLAKALLIKYGTPKVLRFLDEVQESQN